jgi:hypothetical protein
VFGQEASQCLLALFFVLSSCGCNCRNSLRKTIGTLGRMSHQMPVPVPEKTIFLPVV